ncbi:MAG: GTP cyclohydrolase MptA [Methanosarcinaceae archaeon]|nr:GTP cyclohydrolase MptA [Methanosarcinaceae archaeon]
MKPTVIQLPDVQANVPTISIHLTRVGVTDVKKMIEIKRNNKRPIILISTFDIFVDLPSDRKGANLSRSFEAMDEVIEMAVKMPTYGIERICSDIARSLLIRHEYASKAEVHLKSEYVVMKKSPITQMNCQEVVDIFAKSSAIRNIDKSVIIRKTIGAKVVGMTACPCAQEIMRDKAMKKLESLNVEDSIITDFLHDVPMATHNQRGIGIVSIEVDDDSIVPVDDIISVIENSMSSCVYELLKRSDEKFVVETAHKNPKFVEDCVRTMAKNIVNKFKDLPDESVISIKQINEESIHRHNAFAERTAILSELKEEIY